MFSQHVNGLKNQFEIQSIEFKNLQMQNKDMHAELKDSDNYNI